MSIVALLIIGLMITIGFKLLITLIETHYRFIRIGGSYFNLISQYLIMSFRAFLNKVGLRIGNYVELRSWYIGSWSLSKNLTGMFPCFLLSSFFPVALGLGPFFLSEQNKCTEPIWSSCFFFKPRDCTRFIPCRSVLHASVRLVGSHLARFCPSVLISFFVCWFFVSVPFLFAFLGHAHS